MLIDVCFTPVDNCTQQIIDRIDNAKNQVLIQAYSFANKPIVVALVNAEKRGVSIILLLDKSQRKGMVNKYLRAQGVTVNDN